MDPRVMDLLAKTPGHDAGFPDRRGLRANVKVLCETTYPIGSMYGIYANIKGVYWWWMLPYIAYMDPMGIIIGWILVWPRIEFGMPVSQR